MPKLIPTVPTTPEPSVPVAVVPKTGEGWVDLLMDPKANGGDNIPEVLRTALDSTFDHFPENCILGSKVDGTPSAMWSMTPDQGHTDAAPEYSVHWCSDGRLSLRNNFDLLDTLMALHEGTRFTAYARRPAVVRLLQARGWRLVAQEQEPYMALLRKDQERAMSMESVFQSDVMTNKEIN